MSSRPGPWAAGRFDVEGHRGAKGLVVENTLASFAAAYSAGVTGVELDVRMTADGHRVVWHDPVLLPLKCLPTGPDLVGARVADLTLAQLRTVDIGSRALPGFPGQRTSPGARISTLSEVLRHGLARAPDVWWTIEVKVDPRDRRDADRRLELVEGVLSDVHEFGVEMQCFVHSFDWSVLELSAQLAPDVLRSALVEASVTWVPGSSWTGSVTVGESHDDVCDGAAAVGAHVISPEHVLVDAAFVDRAHALGLGVLPWTVNDPTRIVQLAAVGVDGIVSDYPDRALTVLAPAQA
ncbi:glycerophosphodiester phosphodiesterase family protein [Terrabacter sp. GCM10028922]|uniref:glycerophosphodiester phosphodiesterase family protein n=1 Tax=Terrabacter sp. GCM10028922 TaxID=3273428 RepID=UPI003613C0E6